MKGQRSERQRSEVRDQIPEVGAAEARDAEIGGQKRIEDRYQRSEGRGWKKIEVRKTVRQR